MYITILKWLGVGFLALALVAGPTVYFRSAQVKAFNSGYEAGYEKRRLEQFESLQQGVEREAKQLQREAENAAKRLEEKHNVDLKIKQLQDKVKSHVQENPQLAAPVFDSTLVSVWVAAAEGRFDTGNSETKTISAGLDGQVPSLPAQA